MSQGRSAVGLISRLSGIVQGLFRALGLAGTARPQVADNRATIRCPPGAHPPRPYDPEAAHNWKEAHRLLAEGLAAQHRGGFVAFRGGRFVGSGRTYEEANDAAMAAEQCLYHEVLVLYVEGDDPFL